MSTNRGAATPKVTDEQILSALSEIAGGNVTPTAAAKLLGVSVSTLRRRTKAMGKRLSYDQQRYRVVDER